MNPQTAFLLLLLLFTVGSYGWGAAAVALLSGSGRLSSGRVRLDTPLNIAVGIALFLAFGGFAVALGIGYFGVLCGWLAVGAVGTVVLTVRRLRARAVALERLWLAALTGLGALAALIVALSPFTLTRWSEADDAPGYTYLAQRLLATGGLIDPFNSRRLQSYGGAELLQSLVLKVAGANVIDSLEAFFYCALAVALVVRSLRRPYALLGIATVGLVVILLQPVGAWSNTGPTFSETVLLLALARLFADHQRAREPEPWLFVLGGVLVAGLFSLRPQGLPAAVAVVVAGALFGGALRAKVQLLLVGAGSAVLALLGWAIALKRSSDAFVFGIGMPSWTQASWSVDPKIRTVGEHLSFLLRLMGVDSWRMGAFGSLVLSVLALALAALAGRRRRTRDPLGTLLRAVRADIVVALFVGNVALLGIFAYTGDGDAIDSIGHYAAPVLLALVLFAVDRAWLVAATGTAGVARLPRPLAGLLGAAAVALVCLFGNAPLAALRHDALSNWDVGAAVLSGWEPGPPPDTVTQSFLDSHYLPFYNELEAAIPAGSYVLSGVEFPGMLDFKRFRFATVDEAYGNSPPPHLPVSGDPIATARYLRSLGITGIIAELSSAPYYYNEADNSLYARGGVRNYQLQDGSLVKWDKTLDKMQQRFKTTVLSDLRYIDLTEANP